MPCVCCGALGSVAWSDSRPVNQRWCGEIPARCVLEKLSTAIGPVPGPCVTNGHDPVPLAWHLLKKSCVPVAVKSAGPAAVVEATVWLIRTLSTVMRLVLVLRLKTFTPSWMERSRTQESITALRLTARYVLATAGETMRRRS